MQPVAVHTQREGDGGAVAVVRVVGELDLAVVDRLREAVVPLLGDSGVRTVVLDVSELRFIDSSGLGCCVELRNAAEEAGRAFELRAVPDSIRRVLTLGGLAEVFDIPPLPPGA